MAGFTLIHGSTQSTGWDRVASRLRAHGHEVATPELPRNQPDWDLRRYAAVIASAMAKAAPRIVVAHSFSGVFLPLVAEHADILVFEAAIIPESRRSVRDQFQADPSMLRPDWVAAGPRWFDPSQQESIARQFLFHDCDEETIQWALGTVALFHTQKLVTEPSPIDAWPDVRCESIICTDDRTVNPEWSRRAARRIGVTPIEVKWGHSPHVSRPEEIARILHDLTRRER